MKDINVLYNAALTIVSWAIDKNFTKIDKYLVMFLASSCDVFGFSVIEKVAVLGKAFELFQNYLENKS